MNCLFVDFHGASAAERSKYAYSRLTRAALYEGFRAVGGCVVLVTCNRSEIYFDCSRECAEAIIMRAALPPARFYLGAEEHLFSLAAGLCSMLAGEDEILGQVRDAYEEARAAGVTKGMDDIFQAAIACGKDVRTRTKISSFACSISTLAANEAARFLKEGGNVLVVGGTGKFGSAVLKNLASHKGLTIFAAERSHGVPETVKGDVLPFSYEERYRYLETADAVVCTTASPHTVFDGARTAEVAEKFPRKRLFIDLAMPPDVDSAVGMLDGCTLIGIDDFALRARENNEKKRAAIGEARLIVEEHLLELRAAQAARRYLLQLGALPPSLAALRKMDPSAFLAEVSERIGEKR